MTEDVRRRMTEEELRRALADMRSIARRRGVDPNERSAGGRELEDVEAVRTAYFWLARLWDTFRDFSDDPDAFGEFGGPEMRRKLPLHRLYAIEERWQTLADAERPLRGSAVFPAPQP